MFVNERCLLQVKIVEQKPIVRAWAWSPTEGDLSETVK
jgi:hypothetical protein